MDAELQQRACEYLALATRDDDGDELLATICDEMPAFPERESTLTNKLHSRGDTAQDRRTWVIGHSGENKERELQRFKTLRKGTEGSASALAATAIAPPVVAESSKAGSATTSVQTPQRGGSVGPDTLMGTTSNGPAEDIMSTLADLDLSSNAAVQDEPLLGNGQTVMSPMEAPGQAAPAPAATVNDQGQKTMKHMATLGGVAPSLLAPLTVAPNIEKASEV